MQTLLENRVDEVAGGPAGGTDRRRSGKAAPIKTAYVLTVDGWVPSKKNCLKLTHGGRAYYDTDIRERLDSIELQLAKQWRATGVGVLEHPLLAFVNYMSGVRQDRDNCLTTLLDALVGAKILKDDSIEYFNSPFFVATAVKTGPGGLNGARIVVLPTGDIGNLLAAVRQVDLQDLSCFSRTAPQRRHKSKVFSRA